MSQQKQQQLEWPFDLSSTDRGKKKIVIAREAKLKLKTVPKVLEDLYR